MLYSIIYIHMIMFTLVHFTILNNQFVSLTVGLAMPCQHFCLVIEAYVRGKQCLVYHDESGRFKKDATFWSSFLNIFLATSRHYGTSDSHPTSPGI